MMFSVLGQEFEQLLGLIAKEAEACYGPRLVSLVVFGSVARGTQRFDSDVDLLIVCSGLPKGRMKRVSEFAAVEAKLEPRLRALRQLGIHTWLSPILRTPEEVLQGGLIYLDMVEDARLLVDQGGFFASFLERLRLRLKELGSVRVRRGNAWYWVLKPDLKPGEVFEL